MPNYKVVDADHLNADLKSVADSIRAKAGIEGELEFPNGFKTAIEGITGGGGSSDDVRYVTFMSEDGTEELGKIPVAVGYDCPNPKFTATKESTAQYTYTFEGWATEIGGSADANALKNITEDKTIYAVFKANIVYYTVRFFDGDTLLHTVTAAYGSTPSYTPKKSGYEFLGWEPSNVFITTDTDCYAQWKESLRIENFTWAELAAYSESGEAASKFQVGDTKSFAYSGGYGNAVARIVGFNHDDKSDGSGKAGITFRIEPLWPTTAYHYMRYDIASATQKTWADSNIRYLLNNSSASGSPLSVLPTELMNVIKPVDKIYHDSTNKVYKTSADTLWLPSMRELGLSSTGFMVTTPDEGATYAGFIDGTVSRIQNIADGTPTKYWTRTEQYTTFDTVNETGASGSDYQNANLNFPIYFCI